MRFKEQATSFTTSWSPRILGIQESIVFAPGEIISRERSVSEVQPKQKAFPGSDLPEFFLLPPNTILPFPILKSIPLWNWPITQFSNKQELFWKGTNSTTVINWSKIFIQQPATSIAHYYFSTHTAAILPLCYRIFRWEFDFSPLCRKK